MEPETAAFGYLRERLFLRTAGPCNKNLWLSATCAVVNGERRSHAPKSRRALSFPISCHYGGDNSSERRSLAALAWFRVALGFNLAQSHSSPVAPYRAARTNHGEFVAGLQLQDGLAGEIAAS
jgi:hypothetical protein